MKDCLVWSHQHGAWWRAGRCGYTRDRRQAGLYCRAEAVAICADAGAGGRPGEPPAEIVVRLEDLLAVEALALLELMTRSDPAAEPTAAKLAAEIIRGRHR
jgi:hypothetical protein